MQKNYEKIREMYQDQETSASLGLVIGAVTESQQLIDHALRSEQEGGPMSMCNALEELRREGVLAGPRPGRPAGPRATLRYNKNNQGRIYLITVKSLLLCKLILVDCELLGN